MRAHRRTRGFTLLEVALALAILGAGVVTCLQIFTGSLRLQERASRQLRVAIAARSKMDSLFAQELSTGCGEDPPNVEGFVVRYCVSEAGPEQGIVLPSGVEPEAYPLALEVNVAWQDARGEKTYTLRSLRLPSPDQGPGLS